MESRAVRKQEPPAEMLLWRMTGRQNIFTAEGEMWKRHAKIVREALNRTTPIEQFANLARKTFDMMGKGGRIRWNDYTHRFTLDAVGTTVIGYDFEALDKPNGPFVKMYHDVMAAISDPPYIFLPSLERWWPRDKVRAMVDAFVEEFRLLLAKKRENPGNDMITYMFEDPDMTETEFRDNVIVTFMGGHVRDFELLTRRIADADGRTPRRERSRHLCTSWVNIRKSRLRDGRRCLVSWAKRSHGSSITHEHHT